ncbi:MAG: U32 family peptidase [Deltaproteobacteria bacterium]|nr:U32 family peptidase [Candidatus Anaeroferrophillacea bacterium]
MHAENRCRIPELLAPAGGLEAFFAALDAGADAIYVGGKEFSARQRAQNFSLYELARMIPYAHGRGVRVYVAVNTLVKEQEFAALGDFIGRIADFGADAVIVQDPGVLAFVRRSFPELPVHVSTQLSIHSAAGVNALAALGCRRVVLARELSLAEIGDVVRQSRIDVEVFVFGALCLSVAGQCQLSSYFGGQSGNRGRCTQPCRRTWTVNGTAGTWLSPTDFSALEFLPHLVDMGVASLKIEGRLKDSRYVSVVTGVFRRALDLLRRGETLEPSLLDELRRDLESAYTRRLTTANLTGVYPVDMVDPRSPASMGIAVGSIRRVEGKRALVEFYPPPAPGDRLKVVGDRFGGSGNAFTLKTAPKPAAGEEPLGDGMKNTAAGDAAGCAGDNDERLFVIALPVPAAPGDRLFKVGEKDRYAARGGRYWLEKLKREVPEARSARTVLAGGVGAGTGVGLLPAVASSGTDDPAAIVAVTPAAAASAGAPAASTPPPARGVLDASWLVRVKGLAALTYWYDSGSDIRLAVDLSGRVRRSLADRSCSLRARFPNLAWWLPAINFPAAERALGVDLELLLELGYRHFVANNMAHFRLFAEVAPGLDDLWLAAGPQVPVSNVAAAGLCAAMGAAAVTLCPELDEPSVVSLLTALPAGIRPAMVAFGYPPLLATRMPLAPEALRHHLVSARRERLAAVAYDDLTVLLPEEPVSWLFRPGLKTASRRMLKIVDLALVPPGGWRPESLAELQRRAGSRQPSAPGPGAYNLTRTWS